MVAIVKTKDPKQSYFFYRRYNFNMDICKVVYVGVDSTFVDLRDALLRNADVDETMAFLMFEDGTEAGTVCSDMELFLRHVTRDSAVVGVDVLNLFAAESEQECLNILSVVSDFMLGHCNKRHVLIPPVVKPSQMSMLDKFETVQVKSNTYNLESETPPCYPFSWCMRKNHRGFLVHIPSNWNSAGDALSLAGAKKYLQAILRYLKYSITEGLLEHNIESRIEKPGEGEQPGEQQGEQQVAVQGDVPVRGNGRGGQAQRGNNRGRGSGRGYSRGVRHGRGGRASRGGRGGHSQQDPCDFDLRVTIAKQKVKKEIQRLRQLLVESATRKHMQEFFNSIGKF